MAHLRIVCRRDRTQFYPFDSFVSGPGTCEISHSHLFFQFEVARQGCDEEAGGLVARRGCDSAVVGELALPGGHDSTPPLENCDLAQKLPPVCFPSDLI